MTVLMTGSSGLIGAALRSFLGGRGHHVRRLRRAVSASDASTSWNPADGTFTAGAFDGVDAVVHLAGESIAGGRWTAARKARIRESRVTGTRQLCEKLARLDTPPKVLVAASAIGFLWRTGVASSSTSRRRRVAGFFPRYVTRGRLRSRRLASEACGSCICVSGLSSARWAEPSRKC